MWAEAKSTLTIAGLLLLVSCVEGPCRHLKNPEMAMAPRKTAAVASGTNSGAALADTVDTKHVFVARPDGSLQCQLAQGESLDVSEKDLGGIRVFSRNKKSDGKMHIQSCGSATGMINIFEIPESSLPEAESRGFRKLANQ
jgi:hypothetical protein